MPFSVRRTAVLLFSALHAAFVLLAPAPQFHNCNDFGTKVRCHVAGLISLTAPMGPHQPTTYDCPACTISGLSAVPIDAPVMVAPGAPTDRLVLLPPATPRSPVELSLGSRGPPAA